MKKYYIIDLAFEGIDVYDSNVDVELEDGWYVDEDGDVVYEFDNPQVFVESLFFSIETQCDYNGFDPQTYIQHIFTELLKCGYTYVNGFKYLIVEVDDEE